MTSKLIKENQDKVQKFAKLLRNKLLNEGCHQTYVNSMSDAEILRDFRRCADCEEIICTPEQQMQAILEFDNAERTFDILYGTLEGHDEEEDDDLNEDIEIIRGKWIINGCTDLAETITSAQEFINYLLDLRDQGYELIEPVDDDYGILKKNDE